MSDAKNDIKAKVAARVQEELASAPPTEKREQKLPLDFLMQCLRHNRIGDATLYAALHRGKYVYVKLWGRWLYWSGHHWMEDIDNLKALPHAHRAGRGHCFCGTDCRFRRRAHPGAL